MPKVTVIVPNYNHEKFLRQRMESVLHQTFKDFEVLFLDDASTDGSMEVFRPFAGDPRIRVVLNETNSGSPFKQWNRGFREATGEYIWIAESDDFAATSFLQSLVDVLDANPEVGMAYSQSWIVKMGKEESEPELLKEWYLSFDDHRRWDHDFINFGRDELANYVVFKNTIPNASAVVFRRSLLGSVPRAPENMRLAGDWMFWAKLLHQTDLAFYSKPLNYFRVAHSHSQRSKTASHGLELMEGLDIYEFVERAGLLDPATKAKALQQQVKLWGSMAYTRRLTWKINRDIYRKILAIHLEIAPARVKSVLLPFTYYFIATPLRRIRPLARIYRKVKKVSRSCWGAMTSSRKST